MHKPLRIHQIVLLAVSYFVIYQTALPALFSSVIYPEFGMQGYLLSMELAEAFMIVLTVLLCFGWLMQNAERFRARQGENIFTAIRCVAVMFLISAALGAFVFALFGMSEAENQVTNDMIEQLDRPAFIFSAAVFAPFMEEMLFRGCVFQPLRNRFGFAAGAAVSALLFGGVHLLATVYAGNWINLLYIFEYGSCGFMLCWAMEKTGSVLTSMLAHAMYNLIIILFL